MTGFVSETVVPVKSEAAKSVLYPVRIVQLSVLVTFPIYRAGENLSFHVPISLNLSVSLTSPTPEFPERGTTSYESFCAEISFGLVNEYPALVGAYEEISRG